MTASSWEELTGQLAARLPGLAVDDVIILAASGNRYTELVQLKNGIALDAVSSSFLPPEGQLTGAQEQALRDKGWQAPERPFRQNWWHEVRKWPLHSRDAAAIADLMVSTLRDVYRVAGPSDIEVRSFKS
jgi:hypothetical protein